MQVVLPRCGGSHVSMLYPSFQEYGVIYSMIAAVHFNLTFPHWIWLVSALELIGFRTGLDPFPHWNRSVSALESRQM
jgi:hypothetical protein